MRTTATRRAILRLIVLLALVATWPRAMAGERGDEIAVVTFNLYHDRAEWPQRLPLIVAGLRALRPDVIALQEVLQHETLPNQARTIAEALGYDLHFVSVDPPQSARRYGNAILTPHPILARGERRLRPEDDGRTVAHARIAIRGRAVDVHATHLHHTPQGGDIRRRQLADMLAHVAAHDDGTPVLLLGDFNAAAAAPELDALRAGYFDAYGVRHRAPDASPAHTTLNPAFFDVGRRIDHVFAERGAFTVSEASIVLDAAGENGVWPSDHFGVQVRLRPLPKPAPRRRAHRALRVSGYARGRGSRC